jgi:hypothetical protein
MCLGSDELLLGPLIDFHTRSTRANVLACSRVGRGAGVKTNMAGWDVDVDEPRDLLGKGSPRIASRTPWLGASAQIIRVTPAGIK